MVVATGFSPSHGLSSSPVKLSRGLHKCPHNMVAGFLQNKWSRGENKRTFQSFLWSNLGIHILYHFYLEPLTHTNDQNKSLFLPPGTTLCQGPFLNFLVLYRILSATGERLQSLRDSAPFPPRASIPCLLGFSLTSTVCLYSVCVTLWWCLSTIR